MAIGGIIEGGGAGQAMSLLNIIQTVTQRLSLVTPAAVVASTDKQVIQLLAMANQVGIELSRRYPWQAICNEFNFGTVDQDAQTNAIPADFDRWVPNTFFNRTTRRPMTGPITARQWQWIKAQPVYSTVYLAWRERANLFLVQPDPPAAQQIYGEYVSKNWAMSAESTPQAAFLNDTDTTLLDYELLTLGVMWRWLQRKGFDYAEDMETYERELEKRMANDGGMSMLSLAPQPVDLNRVNLPDGSFGT